MPYGDGKNRRYRQHYRAQPPSGIYVSLRDWSFFCWFFSHEILTVTYYLQMQYSWESRGGFQGGPRVGSSQGNSHQRISPQGESHDGVQDCRNNNQGGSFRSSREGLGGSQERYSHESS